MLNLNIVNPIRLLSLLTKYSKNLLTVDFDHDERVFTQDNTETRLTENLSSTCTNSFDEESHGTCTNSHDRGSSLTKDLRISGGLGAASIIL